ncbi:hypothetical protein [Hymenobacter glacieicola]|uniref:Uncharacterized protein n=1 Tax=Hymenobacter glacieicola TaxID=1562124 RepID=A0ABQ1X496_9BACT|nr:hypothetical protein [Hymenobacter glacieicola]GGG59253.1 hypothetical protein GCM10011378_39090 [Hymenobacter glacieicola]
MVFKVTETARQLVQVAAHMGMEIDTPAAYEALLKLVRAVRPIAQESLRRTREEQGGQYVLLLL